MGCNGRQGSVKIPPKGNVSFGVFYIVAEATTDKDLAQ
jgi:hypothetical protein